MRKIIHIDMDAFFASVEQRDNPEWRGKPLAVGGSSLRGVVAAASYEARKYGVRSAMPSTTAARLCPQLIFAKPRFDAYKAVSLQIRAIFAEYTDLIEPLSLDEAYLDVTDNKYNNPSATIIAQEIRRKIFEQTGLTASAGISFNKFLAKVASDVNKPNGQKVITPAEADAFLEQLPVERFHGIGKVTAQKLHQIGVYTGADLKKLSQSELIKRFGKAGNWYYRIVRADDTRAVNPNQVRKSIGVEETFSNDLTHYEDMLQELDIIATRLAERLERYQDAGRTITLKIKTNDFQTHTRSRTMSQDIFQKSHLLQISLELLQIEIGKVAPIRLLGIYLSNLSREQYRDGIQLELDL